MTPERAKEMALSSLADHDQFAAHLLNKTWLLFETKPAVPFYISDNPVALQNEDASRKPVRRNLGVAVRGIQIYLPMSNTLVLAFFCRSHETMIRDGVARMSTSLARDPDMPLGFARCSRRCARFRRRAYQFTAGERRKRNWLQVVVRRRGIVLSSKPDFGLVDEMIDGDPNLRCGRRLQVG